MSPQQYEHQNIAPPSSRSLLIPIIDARLRKRIIVLDRDGYVGDLVGSVIDFFQLHPVVGSENEKEIIRSKNKNEAQWIFSYEVIAMAGRALVAHIVYRKITGK